jgi:outer membrane protein assembly factor BamA
MRPFVPALLSFTLLAVSSLSQTGPTATPQQAPRTAPQVQQVLPSYEGQKVTTIELAGQPGLDPQEYERYLVQKPGAAFSQQAVEETQQELEQTARFHAVEIEIRPEAQGVRIIYVLQPAMYFGVYEFPGAVQKFAYSRLLQVADYPPRGAYTPVDVEDARQALETFLHREGYFLAKVESQLQVDRDAGVVNVNFRTTLGRKAKFGKVEIEGADPQETARLQSEVKGLRARFASAAVRNGKGYNYKTLQSAVQYLDGRLMKRGRLAAKVQLVGAAYDPAANRADIKFHVAPGPLVKVDIQGAHLWPWTKKHELPIFQQAGVDPELIQEGRSNLVSYFQKKGYFDVDVKAAVQQPQPGTEHITYEITKGKKHHVDDVAISGNQHFSDKDLKEHIKVEKASRLVFWRKGTFSEKLLRQSAANLKKFYEAEGYSGVVVTPKLTSESNGDIRVRFLVTEGEQDVVQALHIEGNDTVPETQLSSKPLQVEPGKGYSTKRVDEDRNEIIANYLRKGYLNASFRATAKPIDGDKHKLDVIYHITEGPKVQIAKVMILGSEHTDVGLISTTVKLRPEAPLREDDMLTAENRLYALNNIFDWAEIDPRRGVTTQSQEDVLIKVHESKRNDLVYGFGFEVVNRGGNLPSGTVSVPGLPPVGLGSNFKTSQKTFWGPRASIEYTRYNLFGRAMTFTAGGLAGRLDQRMSFNFSEPHFMLSDWETTATISGEHDEENPVFTATLGEAGYQFQKPLDKNATKHVTLSYNFRDTALSHLIIPDLVPPSDRHVRLGTLSATFARDTRDNILDAHQGILESVEMDVTPTWLGSSVDFTRLLAQVAYYKKIKGFIWANSLRLGMEQPFAGSHVPISEKFFSGGGSTLRGFPLNGAGPQRTITACGNPADPTTCVPVRVPVGGNELFIFNTEARIPLEAVMKHLGIAVFYDGGNVFDRVGFHDFTRLYTNNVGIGLRYATPMGPIRIDLGHNLDGLPGVKSTQLFVTIGQAF